MGSRKATYSELLEQNKTLASQLEQLQRQRTHEYFERGPSYFQMVKHFHEVYGLAVRDEPIDFSFESIEDNASLFELRRALNMEEWQELVEAYEGEDLIAYVDAVCDLIYVLCGSCVSFGVDLDACFAEVQRSNMSKLGEDGKPIVREDGKILKGPNFSEPDLRGIIYGGNYNQSA